MVGERQVPGISGTREKGKIMSAGTKFPHFAPRRLLNGLIVMALAASVFSPYGASTAQDRLTIGEIPSASAAEEVTLAPAPQVTDSALLAPTATGSRVSAQIVNTADRAAVVNFFNTVYTPALAVQANWTGTVFPCNPGTTSAAHQTATISMVNYFRAMVGLPDVTLDAASSPAAQDAALMMIAQGQLSHGPFPPNWACLTAAGATSAGESNLALGASGPAAVVAYMQDAGVGNQAVGHRRWITFPPQVTMGTGSTTATNPIGPFNGSNALDVINAFGNRPAAPEFVAWPPQGFVPHVVVFPRWSFSFPNANFANATVTMSQGATPINVVLLPQSNNQGFADNTLVWEPSVTFTNPPAQDTPYTVNVNNVIIGGVARNFTYTVTVINAATPGGGGAIGGKGLGISSSAAGVVLTWNTGTGQTGYQVARLFNGVVTIVGTLAANATTFTDTTAPDGLVCYALLPQGTNPQQFSDLLCAIKGFRGLTPPTNFTLRLNQSTTAAFTWLPPAGGNPNGYILVKLGGPNQNLIGTVTSTLGAATAGQLNCWALAATNAAGQITGWTDFECGLPGFSTLNP
jgi:uncharacterized protein YkwD